MQRIRGMLALVAGSTLALAACEEGPTAPPAPDGPGATSQLEAAATRAAGNPAARETADLMVFFGNVQGDPGEVVLRRRPGNDTFSWRLKSSAFAPGHAYTVWIGNFGGTGAGEDGGWGSGGIVGGNGQFTAAGNHCLWSLDQTEAGLGLSGGFRPGTPPDCDRVDVTEPIFFFVLDHGDWEPGDMLERWDPTGGTNDPGTLEGILFAVFG